MMAFVTSLHWWHWWIAAAVLAALETFMPGAVAIWFAASALAVGALLLVVPVPWQLQLVVFAVLGFAAMLAWRRYRPQSTTDSAQPTLNQRGAHYIGQCYVLVRGADQPEGTRVRVTGIDGVVLNVETE